MNEDALDDLAFQRLSVPARLPGGLSRRRFLQMVGAGVGTAAGAAALGPMYSGLEAFAAPAIGPTDGILILIAMDGGNDALNMLVPHGTPQYYTMRPHIAIPKNQVLQINSATGFHPSLPKIKGLYDQGKVAVVQGVGYTPADLSHFTSMGIWMNGWSGGAQPGGPTGWIGRYLDGLPNAADESLLGVVLGTSVPLHMVGAISRASGLPRSIDGAFGIDRTDASDARMFDAISAFGSGPSSLGQWGDMVGKVERDTLDLSQRIQPAYKGTFPTDDIGQQLVLCARLINANLGIRVFGTAFGGFDTHSDQPGGHANLMTNLDNAIASFFANISPTFRSRVTIMTFSEFGRRPEDNDTSGTDHGTAGVQLLIGDRVGGGLHGAQPPLTSLDQNGNLVPQVDFRTVYATVLDKWLKADSKQVLGLPVPEPHGPVRRGRTGWRPDERTDPAGPASTQASHRRVTPGGYGLRLRPWPKKPPRGRACAW